MLGENKINVKKNLLFSENLSRFVYHTRLNLTNIRFITHIIGDRKLAN